MQYFQVKNWELFQQYKDRDPKWIKVHRTLLEDYEFNNLPDATKFHLIGIWLLAAKTGNKIPADPKWISCRIGTSTPVKLSILVSAGFLEPYMEDSDAVSICTDTDESVYLEERREEEIRGEKETEERRGDPAQARPTPDVFLATWNTMATSAGLPMCKAVSGPRLRALRARTRDVEWLASWRDAMTRIPSSEFLTGRKPDSQWRANPDWFLRPGSVTKLIEGAYDDAPPPRKPPQKPLATRVADWKAKHPGKDHLDALYAVGTQADVDEYKQRVRARQAAKREPGEPTDIGAVVDRVTDCTGAVRRREDRARE